MKVVLITGASGQLGTSIQRELSGEYKIITTDIDNKSDYYMDISNEDSIKSAIKEISKDYYIDILINNAGISVFTPMMERTWEEFDKVMKTNVYGTFFVTKEVLRHMKHGKIINVASMYGVISPDKRIYGTSGRNSSEVYGMSKASIIQFTKYLATHTSPDVTCNCISPGGIYNHQDEEFVNNYSKKTPTGRMALDPEIANVIKFLCSDDSSYINGQNIIVDGGFSVW